MFTLDWYEGHLRLLDQTRLPAEEVYLDIHDYREVAGAIRAMRVRGAPALGCAAAYGVALAAIELRDRTPSDFRAGLERACVELIATRPTAVNIAWAVRRMQSVAESVSDPAVTTDRLIEEARA